jgi:hypothetical protein
MQAVQTQDADLMTSTPGRRPAGRRQRGGRRRSRRTLADSASTIETVRGAGYRLRLPAATDSSV